MDLTRKQINLLKKNNLVVLATADISGRPRAIFVEVNGLDKGKIVITDNQMRKTKSNLLKNKAVFLLIFAKDYSYGLKLSGKAEYHSTGGYFNFVRGLAANKGYSPKGAVVITVDKVVEF
jgi:uncharacterized pyridoxamine 5'-phosphate oxidase family protein